MAMHPGYSSFVAHRPFSPVYDSASGSLSLSSVLSPLAKAASQAASRPIGARRHPSSADFMNSTLSSAHPATVTNFAGWTGAAHAAARGTPSSLGSSPDPHPSLHHQIAAPSNCDNDEFHWHESRCLARLTHRDQEIVPRLRASIGGKDFQSRTDNKWTCYRRNYFSVDCRYELDVPVIDGQLFLEDYRGKWPIKSLALQLSAVVDGSKEETIDLVQFTAKRDKSISGPPRITELTAVSSTCFEPQDIYVEGRPFFPSNVNRDDHHAHQHSPTRYDVGASGDGMATIKNAHSYQRIQFQKATANNGKKRPAQQHYLLVMSVLASLHGAEESEKCWSTVAQLVSEPIVVRGRSPRHYQFDSDPRSIKMQKRHASARIRAADAPFGPSDHHTSGHPYAHDSRFAPMSDRIETAYGNPNEIAGLTFNNREAGKGAVGAWSQQPQRKTSDSPKRVSPRGH